MVHLQSGDRGYSVVRRVERGNLMLLAGVCPTVLYQYWLMKAAETFIEITPGDISSPCCWPLSLIQNPHHLSGYHPGIEGV